MDLNETNTEFTPETFKIDDDRKADWALKRIAEAEAERDRLVTLAQIELEDLQNRIIAEEEKCERDTAYLRNCLSDYFWTVSRKETATQESYKLIHGSLVYKKPKQEIVHDDAELIKLLDGTDFVKQEKKLQWGEYKKRLKVIDDKVIDTDTGEVVTGCIVEEKPGDFLVKVV